MKTAASRLRRLIGRPARSTTSDFWAYFGSFGDDIFDRENSDQHHAVENSRW